MQSLSKSDLKQSRKEEIANTLTHLFALVVSVFGTVLLFGEAIRLRDPYRIAGASVFGSCLISLYLASSLYHFCQRPRVRPAIRHLFHVADQVNIFIFIAATYTPLLLIRLRGSGGWTFLILIWVFALVGSLIKIFYTGRYNIVTTSAYLGMGWSGVFIIPPLIQAAGPATFAWILGGGLFYSFGIIPYLWQSLPFNHAIWHLFVMGGSLCHFLGIYFHII